MNYLIFLTIFVSVVSNASCFNNLKSLTTTTWSIGSFITKNNASLEFQITITSPSDAGTYPVVFFLSGFDGMCPSIFYSDFNKLFVKNSQHILISFDKFRFVKLPSKEEKIFEITLDWAIENLNGLFTSDKTPFSVRNKVFPDNGPNGYTLMSHSSAAHPLVLYLNDKCSSIKKLVLMDPVDGVDPFGLIKIFVTNPPQQLPFKIPTLLISTGLDPIPVTQNTVACAPNNMSNNRFYDSLPGPTFYLNFTSYGHADILDDLPRKDMAAFLCTTCDRVNKNCDFDTYRLNLALAIKYFLTAVDQKSSLYLNAIEYPQKSGLFNATINMFSKFKLNGFDVLKSGPFCIHD